MLEVWITIICGAFVRVFSGIVGDIKTRIPSYASDYRDGLHRKVVSSSFYLFLACLANAIAFGSLSSFLTHGQIGVIEMLISTTIGGIIYALFSAQPITLLGGTGPIVIFTALFYAICEKLGLDFITAYAWCGLWAGVILIVLSLVNASNLMHYFSRFTDDVFAALVSVIFVFEAVKSVGGVFLEGETALPAAWFGLFLALGTCVVTILLRLTVMIGPGPSKVADLLSDFAPTVAIIVLTYTAWLVTTIHIDGPEVPLAYDATTSGRPWLVDLFAAPLWVRIAAIVPAIFAAVLLFLDQNITSRIINESDAPLKKGYGYHLDILIIGVLVVVFSLFGLPWIVAATVHSVNHLSSLTVEDHDPKTASLGVVENRVSALIIHLAIAASLLLLPYVQLIPMPVLFGLFIYMGLVSLQSNAFFIRLLSLFVPSLLKYALAGDRKASKSGRKGFTLVQGGCFLVLWTVKSSVIGILFPIFIALCVPVRMVLSRFFNNTDLDLLDDYKP
jgi:hypothetical protein